jgi:D-alanyl-D-alanine carboxypeptidase
VAAIAISTWQRSRPGFVGQTPADAAGNITAIYQTPEQGIAAWYFLLSNRYDFGKTGQFDLASLARKYAGQNATPTEVKAYTDGWSKWSNGALQPDTVIHFALDEVLLDLAKAEFAHEAGAATIRFSTDLHSKGRRPENNSPGQGHCAALSAVLA